MSWVKLDDQFFLRPRARSVGQDGRSLFMAGLCYCSVNLTDGFIVKPSLPVVAVMAEVEPSVADLLVTVGLWASHDDAFEVIDYLDYNPSRAQVMADREAARERARSSRERRRDSGGSSDASSTSPDGSPKSSSSLTLVADDDDRLPKGLWALVAQKKLEQQTDVRNPASWLRTTEKNARIEMGERALRLISDFDVSASQLAEALASGGTVPQSWNHYRRKPA